MIFEISHLAFEGVETFTELTGPDWLTSVNTIKGSTMDYRWFWQKHILKLKIGETVETECRVIRRIS